MKKLLLTLLLTFGTLGIAQANYWEERLGQWGAPAILVTKEVADKCYAKVKGTQESFTAISSSTGRTVYIRPPSEQGAWENCLVKELVKPIRPYLPPETDNGNFGEKERTKINLRPITITIPPKSYYGDFCYKPEGVVWHVDVERNKVSYITAITPSNLTLSQKCVDEVNNGAPKPALVKVTTAPPAVTTTTAPPAVTTEEIRGLQSKLVIETNKLREVNIRFINDHDAKLSAWERVNIGYYSDADSTWDERNAAKNKQWAELESPHENIKNLSVSLKALGVDISERGVMEYICNVEGAGYIDEHIADGVCVTGTVTNLRAEDIVYCRHGTPGWELKDGFCREQLQQPKTPIRPATFGKSFYVPTGADGFTPSYSYRKIDDVSILTYGLKYVTGTETSKVGLSYNHDNSYSMLFHKFLDASNSAFFSYDSNSDKQTAWLLGLDSHVNFYGKGKFRFTIDSDKDLLHFGIGFITRVEDSTYAVGLLVRQDKEASTGLEYSINL